MAEAKLTACATYRLGATRDLARDAVEQARQTIFVILTRRGLRATVHTARTTCDGAGHANGCGGVI